LLGREHPIDVVDDAVGMALIRVGDGGFSTACIGQHDIGAFPRCGQRFAAHGDQRRLALAIVDGLADVLGQDRAGQDVERQQPRNLGAAFGLAPLLAFRRRDFGERLIDGDKDGVRAGARQRLVEACSLRQAGEAGICAERRGDRLITGGVLGLAGLRWRGVVVKAKWPGNV
jgi:hypothetical protein